MLTCFVHIINNCKKTTTIRTYTAVLKWKRTIDLCFVMQHIITLNVYLEMRWSHALHLSRLSYVYMYLTSNIKHDWRISSFTITRNQKFLSFQNNTMHLYENTGAPYQICVVASHRPRALAMLLLTFRIVCACSIGFLCIAH